MMVRLPSFVHLRLNRVPRLLVRASAASALLFSVLLGIAQTSSLSPTESAPNVVAAKKFTGPIADFGKMSLAFSATPFNEIELSGTVSQPFDPKGEPARFLVTVLADGSTETHIKARSLDIWDRHPKVGILAACSSSYDRPNRSPRFGSLQCSTPLSWALPAATFRALKGMAKIRSATTEFDGSHRAIELTVWISPSGKVDPNDPVTRFTSRELSLDTNTGLPQSLRYEMAPIANSYPPTQIEIRYGDYRNISGCNIPFRIEKLVGAQVQNVFQVEDVTVR